MRNRWLAGLAPAAACALLAACGTNASPPSSATSHPAAAASSPAAAVPTGSGAIKTMSTSKGIVLTNAAGMTLYWFAKDTSTRSNCLVPCKTYWPPVSMSAGDAAGTTLPHGFGTITRPSGQIQLTYDGHPLYTYIGDKATGQITGDGTNLSGGLWWAMTPTGDVLGTRSSSSGSSGGGGDIW